MHFPVASDSTAQSAQDLGNVVRLLKSDGVLMENLSTPSFADEQVALYKDFLGDVSAEVSQPAAIGFQVWLFGDILGSGRVNFVRSCWILALGGSHGVVSWRLYFQLLLRRKQPHCFWSTSPIKDARAMKRRLEKCQPDGCLEKGTSLGASVKKSKFGSRSTTPATAWPWSFRTWPVRSNTNYINIWTNCIGEHFIDIIISSYWLIRFTPGIHQTFAPPRSLTSTTGPNPSSFVAPRRCFGAAWRVCFDWMMLVPRWWRPMMSWELCGTPILREKNVKQI